MPQILGSSVSYRIAVGPQQGRKAFANQSATRDIASFRWKRIQNHNAQSARTLENFMAETIVRARSGMDGFELHDH